MKNIITNILIVFFLSTINGCGGGTSGTTNITGNVNSINARSKFEGIAVSVEENTNFKTLTDISGHFELLNIPGKQLITLVFVLDNKSARLKLNLQPNTNILLKNINLNFATGIATVGEIQNSASSNDSSTSRDIESAPNNTDSENSTTGGATTGSEDSNTANGGADASVGTTTTDSTTGESNVGTGTNSGEATTGGTNNGDGTTTGGSNTDGGTDGNSDTELNGGDTGDTVDGGDNTGLDGEDIE